MRQGERAGEHRPGRGPEEHFPLGVRVPACRVGGTLQGDSTLCDSSCISGAEDSVWATSRAQ